MGDCRGGGECGRLHRRNVRFATVSRRPSLHSRLKWKHKGQLSSHRFPHLSVVFFEVLLSALPPSSLLPPSQHLAALKSCEMSPCIMAPSHTLPLVQLLTVRMCIDLTVHGWTRGLAPVQRSHTALRGEEGGGLLLARLPPVRERERERERQSTGKRVPTAAKVEMQREKASNETASVRKAVTGCVVCPRRWCCSVGDPSTSLLISAQ